MKKTLLLITLFLIAFTSTYAIDGFKVVFPQTGTVAVPVQIKIYTYASSTEIYTGPIANYTPNGSGYIVVSVPAIPGITPADMTNSTMVQAYVNGTLTSQQKLKEMVFVQAQAQAAASDPVGDITVSDGGEMRFAEPAASGNNYTAFKSPALAGNVIYTLPVDDGNASQVLTTDGSGVLSWTTPASGTSSGSGGGGLVLKDNSGTTLGTIISINYGASVTVITSTGHIVNVTLELVNGFPFDTDQIWWTGTSCDGSGYLNDGGGNNLKRNSNYLVYSGSNQKLYTLANPNVNGVSTSVTVPSGNSIENSGVCSASTPTSGWLLTEITNTAAGLPATITYPLTIEAGTSSGSGSSVVYTEVSANTTLTTEDQVVYILGNHTVTLPDPPATGQTINFFTEDVNATLEPGTQKFRDAGADHGTSTMSDFGGAGQFELTLYYNGTKWLPIGR